jgi:V8-like Glu-specific endopeptidase
MSFREVTSFERSTTPYSAIGLVEVTWANGARTSGSAAVVGRNDILTAAHVVYNPDRGGWATGLEFYFGADYNDALGYFESYGYRLTSGFRWEVKAGIDGTFADGNNSTLTSSEAQHDIALIGVSVEIGKQTGWLGLSPGRDFTQTVNAAGYPGGATGLMTERVTVTSSNRWGIYEGNSQMGKGSSGGPLFTDDNYVLGVRVSSSGTSSTWSDLGFSWHWIQPFMDENDALLGGTGIVPRLPTYSLSAQSTSVNEGESARFTLTTTNVAAGTILTYTVSGLSSADVVGDVRPFLVVDSNGQTTFSIPIAADNLTEGPETMTVTVRSMQGTNVASTSVTINDTSLTPAVPTYGVSATSASINEGESARFTLTTTNVTAFTTLTYRITGVQAEDIQDGRLTGTVVVGQDGKATIAIPIKKDLITEGDETLQIAVDNATASVLIKDTSQTISYPSGGRYAGDVIDGRWHGQGTYTFADGATYVGEFRDGKYHGQGTYTFADGDKYVGEYRDNQRTGEGTYTFADGATYVGEFRDGKYHGQGTYTFADGDKYVGEFRDGKYHGQGTFTFADGDKYVGEYRDGKYHGQGTFTFADGATYVGEFRDDKYHGQGTYTFADGNKYVGEFRDNQRNGEGTHTLADGATYVGEFRDDKYHGQGTYTEANGATYVGEFRDNQRNGEGTYTFANGVIWSGEWRENELMPEVYSLRPQSSSIDEGRTAQFDLVVTNYKSNATFLYTISGVQASDITGGQLTGSVTVDTQGRAKVLIPIAADNVTEGPETLTLTLRTLFKTGPGGDFGSVAASVTINDTSRAPVTPTYSLAAGSAAVDEGSTASFSLSTTNIATGTSLSYVISGVQAADIVFGQLTGSVTVDAQGQAMISVPILADKLTEGPETMTVTVRSSQGTNVASASVTINDTSVQGPTVIAPSPANRIEGTERGELLNGTSAVDQINARGGNDTIVGSTGADTIDGGAGLDLVRYNSSSVSASLSKNDAGEIFVRRGSETDTLINVERLQFTDQWVAIDLNGAAGVAGRMIVAAFGRQALKDFAGIGISLVDQGWSSSQLAELIVSAGLLPSGNAEFVKVVYQNVIGNAPNALELAFYVQLLENSSHTQTSLLDLAANTDFSANAVEQSAIGLVGLPYQPSLV